MIHGEAYHNFWKDFQIQFSDFDEPKSTQHVHSNKIYFTHINQYVLEVHVVHECLAQSTPPPQDAALIGK